MQLQTLTKWYWYSKKASVLLAIFVLGVFGLNAQENKPILSPQSEISLLTCGSGTDLYSTFGHTAIRVNDPVNNRDLVFNYGTFQFTDDFYVLFTMGKLNYRLSIENYDSFEAGYRYENRWVKEQILNLSYGQKQAVFEFLRVNYLPKNREYLYDFFYDNCTSRARDLFESVLKEKLHYNEIQGEDSTFKDMLDIYTPDMPWSDAGMDLGLGSAGDRVVNEHMKLFLPDYLLRAYDNAQIEDSTGKLQPFVKEKRLVVEQIPLKSSFDFSQPLVVFWGFALLYFLLSWWLKRHWIQRSLDAILYTIMGLVGWLIMFLWFVTDHTTTQYNLDAAWALPFYIPLGWFVLQSNMANWLKVFFKVAAIINIILLVGWFVLPQDLNAVYIPIIALLAWRGWSLSKVEG
jgi:hypothetical protein